VLQGIDTFDCVHPTRLARHGGALVPAAVRRQEDINSNTEHLNLRNQRFRLDENPLDPTCGCMTCANFSRGYIHHLLKAKEMLGLQAISIHNIHFMNRLMTAIRKAISTGTLAQEREFWA
jgi:queuine tRNA-ribosyltransferase